MTTTPVTIGPLDALLGAGGVLQQYPQHATPTFLNGVFRLRSKILIRRIEFRMIMVGAVSNAVLAADLYNTARISCYLTGVDYSFANVPYLTGVTTGSNLVDTKRVYFDKTMSLPSQAYDATITTPTPQVKDWAVYWEPNLVLDCFSSNATGAGAAWDTNGLDLMIDHVSDSTLLPHPTLAGNFRIIFEFA